MPFGSNPALGPSPASFAGEVIDPVRQGREPVLAKLNDAEFLVSATTDFDEDFATFWQGGPGAWQAIDPPPTVGGGDATIHRGANGWQHWTTLHTDGKMRVASRPPGGAWGAETAWPGYDRPWLATAGDTAYLIATKLNNPVEVHVRSSVLGGPWDTPTTEQPPVGWFSGYPAVKANGRLVLPLIDVPRIGVVVQADDGAWPAAVVLDDDAGQSMSWAAIQSDGTIFVAWANANRILVAYNAGVGWMGPFPINGVEDQEVWTVSIAAGVGDGFRAAWYSQGALDQPWQLKFREMVPPDPGPIVVLDPHAADANAEPRDAFLDFPFVHLLSDGRAVVVGACRVPQGEILPTLCPKNGISHPTFFRQV